MVDIAKFFLEFIIDESCGKCSPCRIGTKRLYDLLCKITDGKGTLEDLTTIIEGVRYHISRDEIARFLIADVYSKAGETDVS